MHTGKDTTNFLLQAAQKDDRRLFEMGLVLSTIDVELRANGIHQKKGVINRAD